jgi:hypothetical protein
MFGRYRQCAESMYSVYEIWVKTHVLAGLAGWSWPMGDLVISDSVGAPEIGAAGDGILIWCFSKILVGVKKLEDSRKGICNC